VRARERERETGETLAGREVEVERLMLAKVSMSAYEQLHMEHLRFVCVCVCERERERERERARERARERESERERE